MSSELPNSRGQPKAHASTMNEWSARIQCKRFEIGGGSFSVVIFLGDVPTDPTQWLTDPAFVGTFDVFANEEPDNDEERNLVVRGFVHLNRSILARSGQTSLEKNVVVPYLQRMLNWGVEKADGTVGDIAGMPSLEVTVLCTPLTLPVGAEYPTEGEPEYYHEITRGRPGGYHDD